MKTKRILECGDTSPLSSDATCRVVSKRAHARTLPKTSQRDAPTINLPTQLERDTLLTPLWVAESIVQEVECYLKADLPPHWARRLAAKAHYLYPRHKHFKQGLHRPGNRRLENLRMFMRHWTAGWLKRERYALYKQFPRSYARGRPLPAIG